jgi:hypothetical protein
VSEQNPSSEVPQSPQQSFGSAPHGLESFGSAPPPAETFGSAPAVPAEPPAAPQQAKKGGILALLGGAGGIVAIALIVILGGAVWFFTVRNSAANADVGQCLAGTTPSELKADKLKIVDCGSEEAGFKVVGRVDDKKLEEGQQACEQYSDSEFVFWSGKDGESGTVLCLAQVKK